MNTTMIQSEVYEVFEVIGQGSVSTIYEGYDHVLKREVAIKELRPEFQGNAEISESFWGEATLLAGLNHANILRVYAIERERNWIVMELMHSNVKDELQSKKLPFIRIRDILRQTLEGLRYLHSMNRVHGQIRLDSLLVDSGGNLKLSNLSESDVDGEFRRPDEEQLHSAPEILNPRHFGQPSLSSDLYCVGIVALQLLAGDKFLKLFKGMDRKRQADPMAWSAWHASSEPIGTIQAVVADLPSDLLSLVEGLTQKQVGLRFSTAAEAIGAISPQWGETKSSLNPNDENDRDPSQLCDDGPTVTYNSPNLYSPKVLDSQKRRSFSWKDLVQEATLRFPVLRNRKALLSVGGVFVGLLMLMITLIPEIEGTSAPTVEVETVVAAENLPERSFSYDLSFDRSDEPTAPVPTGQIKVFFSMPVNGPELNGLELFVDGRKQEINQAIAAKAALGANLEIDGENTLGTQEIASNILAMQSTPSEPIVVTCPVGRYEIKLKADNYNNVKQVVNVSVGKDDVCELRLTPLTYNVKFSISPSHAKLFVDGEPIEVSDGRAWKPELAWGNHRIEVSAEGFYRSDAPLIVNANRDYDVKLVEIPVVSRTIDSYPQGAEVHIDGVRVGQTPLFWTGRKGEHLIQMELPAFQHLASTVRIEDNPSRLFWYLKR